jgi:hypothetical protein
MASPSTLPTSESAVIVPPFLAMIRELETPSFLFLSESKKGPQVRALISSRRYLELIPLAITFFLLRISLPPDLRPSQHDSFFT